VCLAVVFVGSCGKNDNGNSTTSPTPVGNTPQNPPASGVALVSGNWTGTSDFQQSGVRYISNFTATMTQFDRRIEGTIRFTSPGWEGWIATVNGQVAGTSPDTQFTGNIVLTTPTTTNTGTCGGQTVMAGKSINTVMRWEAASMILTPNGPGAADGACRGEILTLVWIFGR
jgi:hypothetical protein